MLVRSQYVPSLHRSAIRMLLVERPADANVLIISILCFNLPSEYELVVRQQPKQARLCNSNDKCKFAVSAS